ncbi:hypothetical protein EGI05_16215 [Chryseobacterium daecheongense]|uniref:Uncharacterized protein n=1 Tax=Chryseobacterium daecheongense TaxID=192389 RepID=A0A3N0VTF9_9FLAO|nr:hypothetical protein EGI05_16215 [Chryseobacterium daecheongense]
MEKIFHILNGDCLAEQLKETSIKGGVIICREALISGDIKANSLEDLEIKSSIHFTRLWNQQRSVLRKNSC